MAIDLTGTKLGKITAIRPTNKRLHSCVIWTWRCDCGTEFDRVPSIVRNSERRGHTSRCPECRHNEGRLLSGMAQRNQAKGVYMASARNRGLEWRLDDEQFDALTQQNCHYCGMPPSNTKHSNERNGAFIYNGIDRIDSKLDYVPFNCVPCCKNCNRAKRSMAYTDFVDWFRRATHHWESKYA